MSQSSMPFASGGGATSADKVSFDPTGTDLLSTDVEGAIKEVSFLKKLVKTGDDIHHLKFRCNSSTNQTTFDFYTDEEEQNGFNVSFWSTGVSYYKITNGEYTMLFENH